MKPYYQDELVTLYHGDCLQITDWLAADVLVTDPPYGMALKSGWGGAFGDLNIANDGDTKARDAALAMWGDKPALAFGRWSVPRPTGTQMVLTWEKSLLFGMGNLQLPWKPNTEEVYVLGKWPARDSGRGTSVLRFDGPALSKEQGRRHPTEKPIGLMEELVRLAPKGLVADPFAGSGATLVAARNLGRHAIGVELEERYCELIAKRLSQQAFDLGDIA